MPEAPEQALLHELLHYDPESGCLTWTMKRRGVRSGCEAGCVVEQRRRPGQFYRVVRVARKSYFAHVLIWIFVHGEAPPPGMDVDHIDGDGINNRLANLRLATRSQNNANRRMNSNNTSGHRGVYWSKTERKWTASIRVNRRQITIGHFKSVEDAAEAYRAAATRHFGEFINANIRSRGTDGGTNG